MARETAGEAHVVALFFSGELTDEPATNGSLSASASLEQHDVMPPDTNRRVALLDQRARRATHALASADAPPEEHESQFRADLRLTAETGQALVSRQDELERQLRLMRDAHNAHTDQR